MSSCFARRPPKAARANRADALLSADSRAFFQQMKQCAILIIAAGCLVAAGHAAETEVSLVETNLLRVQVHQLTEHFADQLRAATPTNTVIGDILDLRAAAGELAATAPAADFFAAKKLPLVILVDSQTGGAAAALAKNLRAAGSGLVIGSPNGDVQPDIAVVVGAGEEARFLTNPYAVPTTNPVPMFSPTNDLLPYVDHTSEAELVRKRVKDGDDDSDATNSPRVAPPQPVIRDPVLARAVDLLKALAILHPARG
jgi:hypothetical protein